MLLSLYGAGLFADVEDRNHFLVPSRVAYRFCYLLLLGSGHVAARLAADFRVLARARERLGPLAVALQLPVLAVWLVARPVSLAAFSACSSLAPRVRPLQAPSA